jgi:hypothetical protein
MGLRIGLHLSKEKGKFVFWKLLIYNIPNNTMTKYILNITLLLCLVSFHGMAQNDTINLHSGNPIICKVTELSETVVKYQFEGETLVNSLPFAKVASIHLGSGRVIEGAPLVDVSGPDGWQKVIVTEGAYAVEGLQNHGEVTVYGEQAATRPGMQYADNRMKAISYATNDIKKKAAAQGCHLVVIRRVEDVKFTGMAATWKGKAAAAVNVTATLYSY